MWIRLGIGSVTALLLLASGAGAQAIYNNTFVGPGSTVEGDVARGYGIFFQGLGQYALYSAMGRSIDLDTSIRFNEYLWETAQARNREAAKRRAMERDRTLGNYQAIQDRLRYRPEEADLLRGDALNFVLGDLCNPRVDPSVLRTNEVPLKGSTIRLIPFFYGEEGGVISMRKLVVKDGWLMTGRDTWPVALRGPEFKAGREEYRRAVDDYLDLSARDAVTLPPIRRIQGAVRRLRDQADEKFASHDQDSWKEAHVFLSGLAKVTEKLGNRRVDEVLRAMEQYPGTTVAELVGFMQRYNLRFGEARDPIERELYAELYQSFAKQRAVVEDQMGFKIAAEPPPARAERARRVGAE